MARKMRVCLSSSLVVVEQLIAASYLLLCLQMVTFYGFRLEITSLSFIFHRLIFKWKSVYLVMSCGRLKIREALHRVDFYLILLYSLPGVEKSPSHSLYINRMTYGTIINSLK